jgi:hypothetical protein
MSEIHRLFHTMNKAAIQFGEQRLQNVELLCSAALGVVLSKCFSYYLGSSFFTSLNFKSIYFHCIRSTSHIFHTVSPRRSIRCYRPSKPFPQSTSIFFFLVKFCIILDLHSGHYAIGYMYLDFLVVHITF